MAERGESLKVVRRRFRAPPTPPEDAAVDVAKREASFIASDGSVDRFGDVLEPAGWDLTAFRRNPVFLWNHNTDAPIGTVPSIDVKDARLLARTRFIEPGLSERADQLFQMVAAGHLCAVSIGARALADPEPILDAKECLTGFRYPAMELLELSLVSVPANPNALLLGRSYGMKEDFLNEVLERNAPVARDLKGYFVRLRAQVPGLLSPRPAKSISPTSPERHPP